MRFYKIKSFAKLNISLNVIKKIPKKKHIIESLITFVDLHDLIYIRQIKSPKHKVKFIGKFSKNIRNNTVDKLLNILDKKKFLKEKKFEIIISKHIPQKSGMGGGSINASRILNFFLKKKHLNLSKKMVHDVLKKISSDAPLGIDIKNTILTKNNKLIRIKKKLGLFALITKPKFGCSTKTIYMKSKSRSRSQYNIRGTDLFSKTNIIKSNNDLEKTAFKLYPQLRSLKFFLNTLPKVMFVRMSGSGSSIVAYFSTKKKALYGLKLFKRKYKSYWCSVSKTI